MQGFCSRHFLLPEIFCVILVHVGSFDFISTVFIFDRLIGYRIHGVLIDPCKHVQTVSFRFWLLIFLSQILLRVIIGQVFRVSYFLRLEGSMCIRNKRLVKFAFLTYLLKFQCRLLFKFFVRHSQA